MSLSGVLSKGLVSRSVGTRFGRSTSCEDLSTVVAGTKDPIQIYASAPGKGNLVRVLASESIQAVNLTFRASTLDKQHRNPSATCAVDYALSQCEVSSDSVRIVLSLSDLYSFSAATGSGKEYVCSEFPSRASNHDIERIVEEDPFDGLVVSSCDAFKRLPEGRPLSEQLHLVADRHKSRVYIREGVKGHGLELSVLAAPLLSESDGWRPRLGGDASLPLLEDGNFAEIDELSPEAALLDDVMEGLSSGHLPQLTEEGTGGTYFLSDPCGHKVGVFKPMDEEPLAMNCPRGMTPSVTGEGLKKGTRVGEGAFREVAAHILDYPSEGEVTGFAGVPLTLLAKCSTEYFTSTGENQEHVHVENLPAIKLGSLQQFVPAVSNCEDMGPKHFPVHEVHKIAILDMRLANTDRNGANILVQKDGSSFSLIPIDHGYCLPETLEDCTFEWLYWQQARAPFDERSLQYIAGLDAKADIWRLREHGWDVNCAVARTMEVCTMLLKKGAALGLSPFDIGSLMVRDDFTRPSVLEEMLEAAEARVDRDDLGPDSLMGALAEIMDKDLPTMKGRK